MTRLLNNHKIQNICEIQNIETIIYCSLVISLIDPKLILTIVLLKLDVSSLENCEDSDQLASGKTV